MSADRELLYFAAKAAGHEPGTLYWVDGTEPYSSGEGFIVKNRIWNPLTDDGDALRLAVQLLMQIFPDASGVEVIHPDVGYFSYPANSDLPSAVRGAIVSTAAEIGRQMQEGGKAISNHPESPKTHS
jgi:hypothetical protein